LKDTLLILGQALGFLSFAGEAKVQLLPTSWPSEQLPPPTSSLMSIASQKGLLAAAGPDAVIVATTESVRKAFEGPNSGDGNLKPFQPQLKLPMPMRVSQLAFSADESYLVLSAETGGGLAVYDIQALLQGSTQSAFELSTNGQALRVLAPNPTPEKGELLALVTTDGNLMMANLKERSFVTGPNGQVLKSGVSCVSWSTKGKQLVAGLGDGTAYQMTPEGEGKAEIPRPPDVDRGDHSKCFSLLRCESMLISKSLPSLGWKTMYSSWFILRRPWTTAKHHNHPFTSSLDSLLRTLHSKRSRILPAHLA
jgi:nucleoporin NUP159